MASRWSLRSTRPTSHRHAALQRQLIVALMEAAAGIGCSQPTSPEKAEGLAFAAITAEGDATRSLLVAGDTGTLAVEAYRFDQSDCTTWGCAAVPAAAEVRCGSTDQAIVSIVGSGTTTRPARMQFVGHRPGAATVGCSVQEYSDSALVVVVADALPIDSMRTRQILLGVIQEGNLDSVTIAGGLAIEAIVRAYRAGDSTVYLPLALTSSDSAVATILAACEHNGLPGSCDDPWYRMNVLILGSSPGSAEVAVTARGHQHVIHVIVPEAAARSR